MSESPARAGLFLATRSRVKARRRQCAGIATRRAALRGAGSSRTQASFANHSWLAWQCGQKVRLKKTGTLPKARQSALMPVEISRAVFGHRMTTVPTKTSPSAALPLFFLMPGPCLGHGCPALFLPLRSSPCGRKGGAARQPAAAASAAGLESLRDADAKIPLPARRPVDLNGLRALGFRWAAKNIVALRGVSPSARFSFDFQAFCPTSGLAGLTGIFVILMEPFRV
jgi:hypothetical protein